MQNQGPPDGVTGSELIARILDGTEVIDFPSSREIEGQRYGKVRLVVPPAMTKVKAKGRAGAMVRAQLKEELKREVTAQDLDTDYARAIYNDLLCGEMVAETVRGEKSISTGDVPVYPRLFKDGRWVLENLWSEEIAVLMNKLGIVELEHGPREQVLTDDPIILQLWMDRIKEGMGSTAPLAGLAWLDLAELCRFALGTLAKAVSSGFQIPGLPQKPSPDSSSSAPIGNSDPGTGYSTDQPANSIPSPGASELLSPEQAAAKARELLTAGEP